MSHFVDEILEDIDWRTAELASIKSIPIKYDFNENHKEVHFKYAIPAIYAIWEGFVKSSFTLYLKHLNQLNIKRNELALNLLTHYIDTSCQLHNPRLNFESKRKVVNSLDNLFIDTINLSPNVPTESNVNYKVLSNLLSRFCIDNIDNKYEKGLDRLLLFRNKIAHGENALKVKANDMNQFIDLVENLMLDVLLNIDDCVKKQSYKREINN